MPRASVVDDEPIGCVAIEVRLERWEFEAAIVDGGEAEPVPDFRRMHLEPGPACCWRKPFTPNVLLTTVNECLTTSATYARLAK